MDLFLNIFSKHYLLWDSQTSNNDKPVPPCTVLFLVLLRALKPTNVWFAFRSYRVSDFKQSTAFANFRPWAFMPFQIFHITSYSLHSHSTSVSLEPRFAFLYYILHPFNSTLFPVSFFPSFIHSPSGYFVPLVLHCINTTAFKNYISYFFALKFNPSLWLPHHRCVWAVGYLYEWVPNPKILSVYSFPRILWSITLPCQLRAKLNPNWPSLNFNPDM